MAYQKVLAQVHMKMRPLIETMNRKRLDLIAENGKDALWLLLSYQ